MLERPRKRRRVGVNEPMSVVMKWWKQRRKGANAMDPLLVQKGKKVSQ